MGVRRRGWLTVTLVLCAAVAVFGQLRGSQAAHASTVGLVAAYSADQGSGSTLPDLSGNGNTGTLSAATWSPSGKFGSALSFNGSTSIVNVPDSNSLDLTNGMTLEAWVNPSALGATWRTVLMKEQTGDVIYDLYGAGAGSPKVPTTEIFVAGDKTLSGGAALALNTWTHIASTYDGNMLRLYVNGTQVSQLVQVGSMPASTGALRIGGNNVWGGGEHFQGLIDEVRIYNRALTQSDIQSDMNTPVASPDQQPPTAPTNLIATASPTSVNLTWTAATDNVGVHHYNVHRGTTAGFTPSAANRIAQPTGTSYTDAGLAAGTYYYKVTAEDAAGNVGPPSNEASATIAPDTQPPTAPTNLLATASGASINLSWTAATDNVGVHHYNVHRGTTAGFTPSSANRIAQPTGTSYTDAGLAVGTYYYKVTAEDAAGNVGPPSNEAGATITDTQPPTAPANLVATASGSSINLTWTAASDNVGVDHYNVHRGTTSGFTPSAGNRIAQQTGTSYTDPGLATGTYYYKVTAEDVAGNVGPPSNEASASIPDTQPPTAPTNLVATDSGNTINLTWTAATDNVGVHHYNVHRATTSGFTPTSANRIAQPTGTSYTDGGLAAGTYYYKVTAADAAGNVGPPSNEASATASAAPTGLVAAYGFDEGSGLTTADQSGNGNVGTLANATWAGAGLGKFGNALSFNGSNAIVNIPDSASLHLTTGMTLEAWVKPTSISGWSTAIFKERTGYYAEAIYANTSTNRPSANVYTAADNDLRGTAQVPVNTWTHLAATYDGTVLALYVNGTQAATMIVSGQIISNTGALRIGGNTIWGEYFSGLIDEVRVYNRALTAGEIQTDMSSSVTMPDTQPPSAPGTLTATGGLGQASLAWGAATDNVGVHHYNVHRGTTSGFTPSAANRIAQPTGTSYMDTGLAAGTYYYRVTAEDAAGNVGPPSNEATATVAGDTSPPTVSITAPANGATVSGTVTVTANASDNGTVAGVQFKLDGANLGAEDTTAPYSVSWDTFSVLNGTHTLSAVARDGAGNTGTATPITVTVQNSASAGIVGAWAFDEGSGTTTADRSGRGNNGTLSSTTWASNGRFNKALLFNGSSSWVTVPDSSSLDLTTGMTVEAWLKPTVVNGWQTAVVKEQSNDLVYGLYANTSSGRPQAQVFVSGAIRKVDGTAPLPVGVWTHLAATYDGSTLRMFVNGSQVAQLSISGQVLTSSQPLRIGGNGIWGEYYNGLIDEARVYNRALSAGEIQNDMFTSVTPDMVAPTVVAKTPANGAAGINAGTSVTASFSELLRANTLTPSTFVLRDSTNTIVPANVTYDSQTSVATLVPQAALQYGATYTATVAGGSGGVTDYVGNPLAADVSGSFTVEASPPQILIVTSPTNRFASYLTEILRNEGLDAFTTIDVSFLSPSLLSRFDVVVLGETALSSAQVGYLSDWVTGGGNLIAMRPDPQLASLLGLTSASGTLANAYLKVDATQPPGQGIVSQTIQFHGTADKYTLSGASAVASLYSDANTQTPNPAVSLRSVGSNGGQAAAFSYDLARSVVYTRQGNPAWAGQERDGVLGVRPDDLFFGAKTGDVQPDWVNTAKIAIPQADEQQRLLVNMITLMERDKLPLPHFWYLPRGLKAAVVMSGDDHALGGTGPTFDRWKVLSPAGCSVANWECVRATSYVYPDSPLTNAQAAGYVTDGFEVALHPSDGGCNGTPSTLDHLNTQFDTQLAQFAARYTTLPAPVSSRTHCVEWPGWVTQATAELGHGIRMDANYYHFPDTWIGNKPGFMTGGGFPMRFADTDGSQLDIYQQNTNMTDESGQLEPTTVNSLLDKATGAEGYYGTFGVNMHTDHAPTADAEAIVASAQTHGAPVVSYKQLLTWVDGRNSSTIRSMSWSAGTFSFTTTAGIGATGLRTMLPTQGPTGTLSALTCGGSAMSYTLTTIKGVQYAMFATITGSCQASYS